MEIIVIILVALVAVSIVASCIMWVEISGLTTVLAQTREKLRDHLYKDEQVTYEPIISRHPPSPIVEDVEVSLPWEREKST